MADKIDQAASSLEEFSAKRNVDALEKAVEALEETDLWSFPPAQRLAGRRRLLLNWSRVLVAIDSVKDPGYDPDADPPRSRVYPPGGYPAGTQPKDIREPALRAQYEAAIAANEKKKVRARTQSLADELDGRAVESAHRVVDRWYTKSAADQKEIDTVFQEAGLSKERAEQVRSGPKPTPPSLPPKDEDQ